MAPKKLPLSFIVLILTVASIAIIYYVVTAQFYATGVFWDGAAAGISGCLFLSSLALTIFLVSGKGSAKRYRIVFSALVVSGLVTAVLLLFKPGDSDVWWYGAIAGFLSCLSLFLLTAAAFIVYRLINNPVMIGRK